LEAKINALTSILLTLKKRSVSLLAGESNTKTGKPGEKSAQPTDLSVLLKKLRAQIMTIHSKNIS